MFDSVALDVVIGLVFIFLLYSLLATTINEGIASFFNLRAQKLEVALIKILDDGINYNSNIWTLIFDFFKRKWSLILTATKFVFVRRKDKPRSEMSLLELFYDHPSIKYLGENKIQRKPSYISPDFFSRAIIDILKTKGLEKGATEENAILVGIESLDNINETKGYIASLYKDAGNDTLKFKRYLEKWFNETMYRTTGWYKKQSQRITFVIGFGLAITFNLDTISMVGYLSKDKAAASKLSNLANQYIKTHKDEHGQLTVKEDSVASNLLLNAKAQVEKDIKDANSIIGLGWEFPIDTIPYKCSTHKNTTSIQVQNKCCHTKIKRLSTFEKIKFVFKKTFASYRKLLGYLITALAISFGAPFWFDLLSKFMQLRGAGQKPVDQPKKST